VGRVEAKKGHRDGRKESVAVMSGPGSSRAIWSYFYIHSLIHSHIQSTFIKHQQKVRKNQVLK
jgi:hypothetical protein